MLFNLWRICTSSALHHFFDHSRRITIEFDYTWAHTDHEHLWRLGIAIVMQQTRSEVSAQAKNLDHRGHACSQGRIVANNDHRCCRYLDAWSVCLVSWTKHLPFKHPSTDISTGHEDLRNVWECIWITEPQVLRQDLESSERRVAVSAKLHKNQSVATSCLHQR